MFEMRIDRPLYFKYKKVMINYSVYSHFFNQYLHDELKRIKSLAYNSLRGTDVDESK